MARIFFSYSRKDEGFARRLATDLERLGADVWIDVDDIPAGMKWSRAIQQGLNVCEVMLVIISPDSMASTNVEDEWQDYLDRRKHVIPLLGRSTAPAQIHFQLGRIQYIDFVGQSYDVALNKLRDELWRKGVRLQATLPQLGQRRHTRRSLLTIGGIAIAGGIAISLIVILLILSLFATRNAFNASLTATQHAFSEKATSIVATLTADALSTFRTQTMAGTSPSGQTYVVQPGDSTYSIAIKFGVTVQALMAANGIANPNLLFVGQVLIIPGAQ